MVGSAPDRDAAKVARGHRKAERIGLLAGWVMRLWFKTLRVRVEDRGGLTDPGGLEGAAITVLWHNRVFVCAPAWRKHAGGHRGISVLTSPSRDGTILAKSMGVLGFKAVRGSSSRGGAAALIALRRVLRAGGDVAITPDGPRGPRYEVQGGVLKLAQSTGVPLIPLHARCSSAWRLRTWDGFMIPKPFSRVTIVFGQALVIPRELDDDGFEAWRAKIEQVLRDGVDDLDFEPKKKREK
jgi:lysophospholipid acyltransferase (LPLAT)-like uncharacterized protein